MNNIILRPAFNRPEMLFLSIESEIEARKYFEDSNYKTIFCLDYGFPKLVLKIIEDYYPFDYEIHMRNIRLFGWGNILEGFKHACNVADSHVINLEDDCLIHKSYFKYIFKVYDLIDDKCSVINTSNRSDPGRNKTAVEEISKTHRFEATCCVIMKDFFNKYVRPYSTAQYYRDRASVIDLITKRNGDDPRSKYRPSRNNTRMHIGWDGLVNRLVDAANIEEGRYTISPQVDRRIHIGFYGQNRHSNFNYNNEKDFFKRVDILREIIKDPDKMSRIDGTYSDYESFAPELDAWSGRLILT